MIVRAGHIKGYVAVPNGKAPTRVYERANAVLNRWFIFCSGRNDTRGSLIPRPARWIALFVGAGLIIGGVLIYDKLRKLNK